MTQEQWARVKEIVGGAIEQEPEKRATWIAEACGPDAELRAEVESLVNAHAAAGGLSDNPWSTTAVADVGEPKSIGPYRLIRRLGVGGMGQVWLADQTSPVRRRIALKLIKPGIYDESVVQRFRAERQSLALMDHPAIAKVFDAGATPAGEPFFAMEYVDGLPITTYCDRKRLGIRERLALFVQVCEGVQHAHQKAIIHRDLKPSNILVVEVDGKAKPRIIDFGLAKATTPTVPGETLFTQVGAFLGTPGYMSPEQADPGMHDIDTRTDVYSLGVVLYELLTGFLPFDTTRWQKLRLEEVLRQLRETDPQSPSTKVNSSHDSSTAIAEARATEPRQLVSTLRGDLDWITMKALEKERERRYGTPIELAQDLDRYLQNRPVIARPASAGYRLGKYLRRNRLAVAVATAAIVVLVAFGVTQTVQLRRITRERDRADRVTEFMTNMFKVSDPGEARGNTITAREILDRASKNLGASLAKDPAVQADLLEVMARTYVNLGLYSRAHELQQHVLDTRLSLLGPKDRKTLQAMSWMGWILDREGQFPEAEKLERQALEQARRDLPVNDLLTLETMNFLAIIMQGEGHYKEEEALEREVIEGATRTLGAESERTLSAKNNLGAALLYEGRFAEAENVLRPLLEVERRVLGADHPQTLLAINNLAGSYAEEGQLPEAERLFREALATDQRVLGPEHSNTALALSNLANVLGLEGHWEECVAMQRKAVDIYMSTLGPKHSETVMARSNLAGALFGAGHLEEAEKLQRENVTAQIEILGPEHARTLMYETDLATTLLAEHRSYPEAERLSRHAFERQVQELGPEHPDTLNSLQQLGKALAYSHRYPEAVRLFRKVIETKNDTPDSGNHFGVWYSFACVAVAAGEADEALQYLREAIHRGYSDADGLLAERDLSSLHQNTNFQKLVADLQQSSAKLQTK